MKTNKLNRIEDEIMAEERQIPPIAREWEDAKTNQEYWWNKPNCAEVDCRGRALSFRERCWYDLSWEERSEYREEIISRHHNGESLRGLNLRGASLEGANLGGARLEGTNLELAGLEGVYLRGARLEGAHLSDARLDGADLYRARLEGANLGWARLERAYLRGARLGGANLIWARLEGANLEEASLEGAHLIFASLEGADLRGASIKGADLTDSSVGSLGYTQSEAEIERRKDNKGEEEWLVLLETNIKAKRGTTDFTGVKYNPHTRGFLYPLAILGWRLVCLWRRMRKKEAPDKPSFFSFKKTIFLGIDTTKLDHSKNPTLARDIKYQQFLADFRDRHPRWFYRPLYYLWGITSFFGESLLVWLLWATIILVTFALVFSGHISFLQCNICINGEPLAGFTDALYLSGLIFTSLGLGDFTPQDTITKMLVLAEVMVGFIMLGSLVSFFANKLVRRD